LRRGSPDSGEQALTFGRIELPATESLVTPSRVHRPGHRPVPAGFPFYRPILAALCANRSTKGNHCEKVGLGRQLWIAGERVVRNAALSMFWVPPWIMTRPGYLLSQSRLFPVFRRASVFSLRPCAPSPLGTRLRLFLSSRPEIDKFFNLARPGPCGSGFGPCQEKERAHAYPNTDPLQEDLPPRPSERNWSPGWRPRSIYIFSDGSDTNLENPSRAVSTINNRAADLVNRETRFWSTTGLYQAGHADPYSSGFSAVGHHLEEEAPPTTWYL